MWRVAAYQEHSKECDAKASDPEHIQQMLAGPQSKNQTLVSLKFLASLCHPIVVEKYGGIPSSIQPKYIAEILIKNHWLPPLWNTQAMCETWLHTITSKIKKLIVTQQVSYHAPTLEQLISMNNSSEGVELTYLSSFAEVFKSHDPDNQVIIEVDPATRRYRSCYIVFGIVKRLAAHEFSTFQLDLDACHFKHPLRQLKCPGNLRAVVYTDATGSIFPLLIGHESSEESIETWQYCMDLLLSLFPNPEKLASDRDKGLDHVLELAAADNNFGHVHCYAHLKRNVGANFKKEEKEKAQKFLEKLVYAPTVAAYESVKAEIDKELPELTTYLSSMGPELYVKSHFPFQRLGITSNAIESYWTYLLNWNIREQVHLVSIFKACYEQLITKLHQKSRDLLKWQFLLTKVGVRILKSLSESTSGMKVTNLSVTTDTVPMDLALSIDAIFEPEHALAPNKNTTPSSVLTC